MRPLLLALLIVAAAAAADAPKPTVASTPPETADAAAKAIQAEIRAEMKNTGGDRHEAEARVAARHAPGHQVTPADEAAAKAAADAKHNPPPMQPAAK